ncbi:tetratricopeptide repeat protein [Treponema sp.]|uniref:tetratricopeptide repeat protein n=1 Tax=Treponema sp. TaxID=166 RepID=UPI00388F70F3
MKIFFKILPVFIVFFLISCSKPGDLTIQRAMRAYQNQNYEEALSLFNEAAGEESNYSQELICNMIASIYLQQEDLENAVVYQKKSCELRPEYRNLVSLGMTYHLLQRDTEAEEAYRKAVELNPQKGEAYASLGSMYLGQKKYAEAVENLKKASELEPKIAVIHANLAIAYAASGENEKSESEFNIAEELKCENLDEFKERAKEIH